MTTVCRVGGRKFSSLTRATAYPANDFAVELKECFGIDVEKDEEGVHPPSICVVCRRLLSRFCDAAVDGRSYRCQGGGCGVVRVWEPHSAVNCQFCSQQGMRLGRPPKKRRRGGVSSAELLSNEPAKPQEESEATGVCVKSMMSWKKTWLGKGTCWLILIILGPVFFRINLARLLSF